MSETVPWAGAEVTVGGPPQAEVLFPRPVLLICDACGASGYWYPEENTLMLRRPRCPLNPGSTAHAWGVLRWNGNAEREAPVSELAQRSGAGHGGA